MEAARQQQLKRRVYELHYLLAGPEDRARMEEPKGWRPKLARSMSLDMQMFIL